MPMAAIFIEKLLEGLDFDFIADPGAGSMGLDQIDRLRMDACRVVSFLDRKSTL